MKDKFKIHNFLQTLNRINQKKCTTRSITENFLKRKEKEKKNFKLARGVEETARGKEDRLFSKEQ